VVSTKQKLILLLPPKTGSSSLVRLFMDAGVEFDRPVKKVSYPVYHLLLSEIREVYALSYEQLNTFSYIQMTRNPYQRAVSSWLHQMELTGKRESLDAHLNRVSNYRNLLPDKLDEFYAHFYDNPEHKDNSFKRRNWGGARFYFQQSWWNDLNIPFQTFKLEEISESTDELAKYCGLQLPSLKKIKKNRSQQLQSINYFQEQTTIDLIKHLYRQDFEKYNYDF